MGTNQTYDPKSGQAKAVDATAQNTPSTASQAYGSWPVYPALHRPAFVPPVVDASTLATYSALHLKNLGSRYADVCDLLAADETGPISVVEPLTRSLIWAAAFREGKTSPSLSLIMWLATVHPRVNVNYLFRGEGEPLLPIAPVLAPANQPNAGPLTLRLDALQTRLREQVYPALLDPANEISDDEDEEEIVTLSEQALAINLHREFVEACGPNQVDWIRVYWAELGYLFDLLFDNSAQIGVLLNDRVFLELLQSFAA